MNTQDTQHILEEVTNIENTLEESLTHTKNPSRFKKFQLTTPVAVILGALILSFSHITYGLLVSGTNTTKNNEMFTGRPVDASDFATGNTKSDVIVIEYSDTQCQFCAQLHPAIQKIQSEYSSKVAFVYRYFPLTQIHPEAFDEARAIHCVGTIAGAQKRVEYINEMFTYKIGKQNMVLPKGGREALAKNINIDAQAFTSCMNNGEAAGVVNASIQEGITAKVEGTPATFVLIKTRTGYEVVSKIDGARPYEYIKAVIEEALSR